MPRKLQSEVHVVRTPALYLSFPDQEGHLAAESPIESKARTQSTSVASQVDQEATRFGKDMGIRTATACAGLVQRQNRPLSGTESDGVSSQER